MFYLTDLVVHISSVLMMISYTSKINCGILLSHPYITSTKSGSIYPTFLMRALKALSKNKDIVILKPDKGTGIVILNFKGYVSKIEEIVNDQTKFKVHKNQDLYKISRSIENKVRTYLRDNVKKPGHNTRAVSQYLS